MTNANFGTVQHNGKTLSLTQHGGGPMKTLKLFTSDGRALTNLASEDDSILLPNEIRMCEGGECQASHADSGDYDFDTPDGLCANYGLDLDEVRQLLAEVA